jgi:hypothetical protein
MIEIYVVRVNVNNTDLLMKVAFEALLSTTFNAKLMYCLRVAASFKPILALNVTQF